MKKALIGASAIIVVAVAGVILLSGEKKAESAILTTAIGIEGMSCQNCADKIDGTLSKLDGIREVDVRLGEGRAYVKYDASAITVPAMEASINKLGYSAGKADAAISKEECDDADASDCCAQKQPGAKT